MAGTRRSSVLSLLNMAKGELSVGGEEEGVKSDEWDDDTRLNDDDVERER